MSHLRISFLLAAVALLAIATHSGSSVAKPEVKTQPEVIGYYCVYCQYQGRGPAHPYSPKQIDTSGAAAQLTAIYYAFEHVDSNTCSLFHPDVDADKPFSAADSVDGTTDPDGPTHLRGVFHQLQELKKKYPRMKIVMSLGGWGLSSGFPSAAKPENVKAFVSSCVNLFIRGEFAPGIKAPGIFDGIDIDWEYPVGGGTAPGFPEDTKNLTAMAAEFRRQLDAVRPGLWLTAALPGSENHFKDFDLKALSQSMNFLAIMAYDMASSTDPTTSFASALFCDPQNPVPSNNCGEYAVQAFLKAGVPAQKIVLGAEFGGGRHWLGVPDTNHGLYQAVAAPGAASLGQTPASQMQFDPLPASADRQYWPAAGTCSIWFANNFWSYDCPQAMTAKMNYVRAHNLRGIMFWELTHDPNGELLHAISAATSLPLTH